MAQSSQTGSHQEPYEDNDNDNDHDQEQQSAQPGHQEDNNGLDTRNSRTPSPHHRYRHPCSSIPMLSSAKTLTCPPSVPTATMIGTTRDGPVRARHADAQRFAASSRIPIFHASGAPKLAKNAFHHHLLAIRNATRASTSTINCWS
jgi:hypothetical protein